MLCAAGGYLKRISNGVAINITAIAGPKHPLSYVDAEDKVYISNPYWQGIFDPIANSVASWGVAVPPGPMLMSSSGNLPAGTYHVCMTNVASGELSGNSAIVPITLTSEGGIQVLNRPTGALVWITDANEGIFIWREPSIISWIFRPLSRFRRFYALRRRTWKISVMLLAGYGDRLARMYIIPSRLTSDGTS